MKIYIGNSGFSADRPVVTLGMFDGVHRGHRSLLDSVVSKAASVNGESVVITLHPHPKIVLSGSDTSVKFLTSLDEKTERLADAGIDKLLVVPFDRKLSRMSACDFMEKYLVNKVNVKHLVLGFDHQFGYRGQGNAETITECAGKHGFEVHRMEPLKDNDLVISSTIIRNKLLEGSLEEANNLLGYPYMLKGKVVEGNKIGRIFGYPTANILSDYQHKLIPADGVYAVSVLIEGKNYKAMLYIGRRPTIEEDGAERSIEVNIFDFNKDIYRKDLTVRFLFRLRGDRKYDTREELLDQIKKDKVESLRLLNGSF